MAIAFDRLIDGAAKLVFRGAAGAKQGGGNPAPDGNVVAEVGANLFQTAAGHRVGAYGISDIESGPPVEGEEPLVLAVGVGHQVLAPAMQFLGVIAQVREDILLKELRVGDGIVVVTAEE